MTYPGLDPRARALAAACFRQVRRRLAYVRQQEQQLSTLRGFRREMVARTCERIRRETRLHSKPGTATRSRTVPGAPTRPRPSTLTPRPHATHNQRGAYESL